MCWSPHAGRSSSPTATTGGRPVWAVVGREKRYHVRPRMIRVSHHTVLRSPGRSMTEAGSADGIGTHSQRRAASTGWDTPPSSRPLLTRTQRLRLGLYVEGRRFIEFLAAGSLAIAGVLAHASGVAPTTATIFCLWVSFSLLGRDAVFRRAKERFRHSLESPWFTYERRSPLLRALDLGLSGALSLRLAVSGLLISASVVSAAYAWKAVCAVEHLACQPARRRPADVAMAAGPELVRGAARAEHTRIVAGGGRGGDWNRLCTDGGRADGALFRQSSGLSGDAASGIRSPTSPC